VISSTRLGRFAKNANVLCPSKLKYDGQRVH